MMARVAESDMPYQCMYHTNLACRMAYGYHFQQYAMLVIIVVQSAFAAD
jgi:hypothetical protein